MLTHQLTPALRQELNSISFRVSLSPSSSIFKEGDEATSILILRKGHVKIAMNSAEGRTAILYLAAPGELLGLSSIISGTPRQVSATTVEACELDHVRRDEFVNFLNHHSEQFRAALDELSMQHSCILSAIRRFALSPSLLANLARFLLGLNCPDNNPQTDTITLKLSQEEIGQHLGATRESVARALSTLRKNNIVKQSGRTLTILNRGILEHLAGGRTEEAAQTMAREQSA